MKFLNRYETRWGAILVVVLFLFLVSGHALCAQTLPPTTPQPVDLSLYQVAIEAMVIEINENRTRDLGINYTYTPNDLTSPDSIVQAVAANFPVDLDSVLVPVLTGDSTNPSGFTMAHVNRTPGIGATLIGMNVGDSGRVAGNIRALLDQGAAQIRTRPIVVTVNNTPANITTVEEIPYQDILTVADPSLGVAFRPVGVQLQVTPRILEPLEQRLVELNITKMEVSSVSNYITIRQVNRPLFVTSNANTKVWLYNAETLVIAGLKSQREMTVESGIPYLRKIPLFGWLFKSQHKEMKKTDILFFITPYILEPGMSPILPYDFAHNQVVKAPQEGMEPPADKPVKPEDRLPEIPGKK